MNTRYKGLKAALCSYGMLVVGTAVLAFGLYNIHRQSNITEGGVLGLVLFLNHWLGVSPAVISPVLDITCYLIGFRFLGGTFARRSLVATLSFAGWYALLEQFPPLLPSMAAHPVVAAVCGGCFVGLGVGLAVRAGGPARGGGPGEGHHRRGGVGGVGWGPGPPPAGMTPWRCPFPTCWAGPSPGPTSSPTWWCWPSPSPTSPW